MTAIQINVLYLKTNNFTRIQKANNMHAIEVSTKNWQDSRLLILILIKQRKTFSNGL